MYHLCQTMHGFIFSTAVYYTFKLDSDVSFICPISLLKDWNIGTLLGIPSLCPREDIIDVEHTILTLPFFLLKNLGIEEVDKQDVLPSWPDVGF